MVENSVSHVWIGAAIPSAVPGGMRRHMMLHAAGLRELGVRATLAFEEDCASTGVGPVDARIPGARLLAGTVRDLLRDPPDVINVHSGCAPAFIAARRAGLLRSEVTVMSYAADERALRFYPGKTGMLRFLRAHVPARATMRFADGVWCVSREDVDFYVARYRVPRAAMTFIPHAIEGAFFERASVPRRPTQLAFVGTWTFRKGADVLSAALAKVMRVRADVSVVVAGTLGGEADIRAALAGVPSERLRVVPRLEDPELRTLYHETALLLMPSRIEGMPFTMLEAMACGCPSLAAGNSGMRDAIVDGENGWLEASFDPGTWAARILELLAAPERLRAASEAARTHAEAFRLRRVTQTALDWYESRLASS